MFKFLLLFLGLCLPITVNSDWRDPTMPANLPAAPLTAGPNNPVSFNLTAIWISDTDKRAIINGVTVKPGDKLDTDTRILNILPGHVLIRQQGSLLKLYLVPSVKKPLK